MDLPNSLEMMIFQERITLSNLLFVEADVHIGPSTGSLADNLMIIWT